MAEVRVDISIVPTFMPAIAKFIVVAAPALSKTAVSCASGKLVIAGVPPLVVAHAVAFQLCVPVRFQ
jgi:hypothetical protein